MSSYSAAYPAGVRHAAYGTRVVDSSGGQYLYVKASTVAVIGSVVFCAPGADPWQATIHSSGGALGISTVQGALLGVQNCTAGTTTQDMWMSVAGPMTALIDTTAAAPGISLFLSTTVAGAFSVTTTGARVFGAYIQSSGGAGQAAPVLVGVMAPAGLVINIA